MLDKDTNSGLFYIETFGCQMNERDSEIMAELLGRSDYALTNDLNRADLVLLNTCSIRDKAEQKVYSMLGRLRQLKKKKQHLIIAVAGCVAQQQGGKLQERMEHVDIVIGTQNIYRLPQLVERVRNNQGTQLATTLTDSYAIPLFIPSSVQACATSSGFKRFVTIMQGCNNYCTYCVVPYTRGREVSRPRADILAEIRVLLSKGIREITLLGQNVNSYGMDGSEPDGFADLLRVVAGLDGLKRLRFTTSNPKDLSDELIRCFAEVEILCPHFHLPVQSGSDTVLHRMNRKYSVADYLARVQSLRRVRPDIALTTDFIVGFPGETEQEFEATMDLLEKVRFHSSFSFKYSDRPLTRSAAFDNKVEDNVKSDRLTSLQARQNEITLERNQEYVGTSMEVMVEGESRSGNGQWQGRTVTNHIVNFDSPPLMPGQIVTVLIKEGLRHSLRGTMQSNHTQNGAKKND